MLSLATFISQLLPINSAVLHSLCHFLLARRVHKRAHFNKENKINLLVNNTDIHALSCRFLQGLKAVNDVRSRASARKTGAGIWRRI